MKSLVLLLVFSLFPCGILAQTVDTDTNSSTETASTGASRCTDLDGNPEACPEPVAPVSNKPAARDDSYSIRAVPSDIVHQQARFWTSPLRMGEKDLNWAFPFALGTATLMIADPSINQKMVSHPNIVSNSQTFSNLAIGAIVGSAGGMYVWGHLRQNDELSHTGFMAGEAGLNSFLSAEVIKEITQRARPMDVVPSGSRGFGQGGSSFPSEHSAAAWAVASVVAHQYPGTGTKIFAYGLAAAISASRVTARQHFASDAFVGSALGWYIGRQVWESHQVPDQKQWGVFERPKREGKRNPDQMSSPYVPLESWVYPAFDRLSALGYVQSDFRDMRPWTRMECARLLEEAQPLIEDGGSGSAEARGIYQALSKEFAVESRERVTGNNTNVVLDSIYTRAEGISGTPLRDGYHFAQTITNDNGRPYGEGFNLITGASGYATAGPVMAYARGEYQRAPSALYVPTAAQSAVSQVDGVPLNSYPTQFSATSQFDLLEGYVSLNVGGLQMSFGKQAEWWGPGESGSLMFGDNAEPVNMVRVNRTMPVKLPSVLGVLGPMRAEFFVGQLSGQRFQNVGGVLFGAPGRFLNPQPYFHGEKFSFKPTPNFEFSVSSTSIFAGEGRPFTARRFISTVFSTATTQAKGASDPGKRQSEVDFSYKIPKLRNWLTLYADAMSFDEISPLGYPRMSAMNPGIYMPRIPKIPKLDFRAEGVYTPWHLYPGFFYYSVDYLNGYTNKGQLLGNWIGRQGTGFQAWSNYWFSPRSKVQVGYRQMRADRDFLQGGTLNDFNVSTDFALSRKLTVSTFVQLERWNFPLLSSTTQRNVTASVQLEYHPQWRIK